MLRIVAKHYIKKDKIDSYIALAKKLVAATNKEDEGCLHYETVPGRERAWHPHHHGGMDEPGSTRQTYGSQALQGNGSSTRRIC